MSASRSIHDNLIGMKLRDVNFKPTDSSLASPMRLSRRILAPPASVLSALSDVTSAEANSLATFLACSATTGNAEVIPDQHRAPEIAVETSSR